METQIKKHHIWCNNFNPHSPNPQTWEVETCKMCVGLYRDYPQNGLTEEGLMTKFFPNNVKERVD